MSEKISPEIETTLNALRSRGINAKFAENRQVARKMIVDLVPENWIVGVGDSTTIRSLGVLQDLIDMGNRVLDYHTWVKVMREKPQRTPLRVMKQTSQGCDVYIASSNTVTMDGKLVNTDGGGARVTGMVFGSPLSIVVAGRNKIVKDVDAAFSRIKNVIAPAHAKNIGPDWGFPCVATGKCVEPETFCGPQCRICNITVILESKSANPETEMVVMIVDEDMGLGWDPAWPKERIDKIYAEYKQFTPPHRPVTTK